MENMEKKTTTFVYPSNGVKPQAMYCKKAVMTYIIIKLQTTPTANNIVSEYCPAYAIVDWNILLQESVVCV